MHATSQKQIARGYGQGQVAGRSPRTSGFSLTELLVVIAIIVLLIGLLLAALAQVRKKTLKTQTEATMQQFANACAVFQSEHGFYPGVIPDAVIAAHAASNGGVSPISSTENALLHLMGGYRVLGPNDTNVDSFIVKDYDAYSTASNAIIDFDGGPLGEWHLKIKTIPTDGGEVAQLGEGPFINGKPYPPYFTPDKNSLVRLRQEGGAGSGQIGEPQDGLIPDLVDAWGQPIIYVRQARDRGPLVKDPGAVTSLPQFDLAGLSAYVNSQSIGEKAVDQTSSNTAGSVFSISGGWDPTIDQQRKLMSVILNNQTFYKTASPYYGKARGAIMLLSAGPDGVYLSKVDGPGSNSAPLTTGLIDSDIIGVGPRVLDEFDDIRIYAGG